MSNVQCQMFVYIDVLLLAALGEKMLWMLLQIPRGCQEKTPGLAEKIWKCDLDNNKLSV